MKMTYDLLQDMSDVTTIPKMRLDQLADNAINFIAHYIRESADCGESDLSVDTGIGVLHIRIEDENIKFFLDKVKSLPELPVFCLGLGDFAEHGKKEEF